LHPATVGFRPTDLSAGRPKPLSVIGDSGWQAAGAAAGIRVSDASLRASHRAPADGPSPSRASEEKKSRSDVIMLSESEEAASCDCSLCRKI
jgi:hypothetical protein